MSEHMWKFHSLSYIPTEAAHKPQVFASSSIFFYLLFKEKIIDLPGGQLNDFSLGRI